MPDLLARRSEYSPEELLFLPDAGHCELVRGRLVEKEMGARSAWIGGELLGRLREFARASGYGLVFPADVGYVCFPEDPKKVRKPDVSLIRSGRLPGNRIPDGHIALAPDLAVEVTSPNDTIAEVQTKVGEYLAAGVPLIWVITPEARTATMYRADGSASLIQWNGVLRDDNVLPGFQCRLGDLFPPDEPGAL